MDRAPGSSCIVRSSRQFDRLLTCLGCGGRFRLVAVIDASAATVRILQHLQLPTEVPPRAPALFEGRREWETQRRRPGRITAISFPLHEPPPAISGPSDGQVRPPSLGARC